MITIIKRNAAGSEVWRWQGEILRDFAAGVLLQAFFNFEDVTRHEMVYRRGDRYREIYFRNKWFNIFEMHDRETDALKGWYCNFSRPAAIANGIITYDDLVLDAIITPDFKMKVLDEEEFNALDLELYEYENISAALQEVRALFELKNPNILDFLAR